MVINSASYSMNSMIAILCIINSMIAKYQYYTTYINIYI